MCYIDLEPCSTWTETKRTARKEHRCSCCHKTITPGEEYYVHFSVFEGKATTGKICLACFADRAAFGAAHDGMISDPGYFWVMLLDCIADGDPDDSRWLPMRDRIKRQRELAKEVQ